MADQDLESLRLKLEEDLGINSDVVSQLYGGAIEEEDLSGVSIEAPAQDVSQTPLFETTSTALDRDVTTLAGNPTLTSSEQEAINNVENFKTGVDVLGAGVMLAGAGANPLTAAATMAGGAGVKILGEQAAKAIGYIPYEEEGLLKDITGDIEEQAYNEAMGAIAGKALGVAFKGTKSLAGYGSRKVKEMGIIPTDRLKSWFSDHAENAYKIWTEGTAKVGEDTYQVLRKNQGFSNLIDTGGLGKEALATADEVAKATETFYKSGIVVGGEVYDPATLTFKRVANSKIPTLPVWIDNIEGNLTPQTPGKLSPILETRNAYLKEVDEAVGADEVSDLLSKDIIPKFAKDLLKLRKEGGKLTKDVVKGLSSAISDVTSVAKEGAETVSSSTIWLPNSVKDKQLREFGGLTFRKAVDLRQNIDSILSKAKQFEPGKEGSLDPDIANTLESIASNLNATISDYSEKVIRAKGLDIPPDFYKRTTDQWSAMKTMINPLKRLQAKLLKDSKKIPRESGSGVVAKAASYFKPETIGGAATGYGLGSLVGMAGPGAIVGGIVGRKFGKNFMENQARHAFKKQTVEIAVAAQEWGKANGLPFFEMPAEVNESIMKTIFSSDGLFSRSTEALSSGITKYLPKVAEVSQTEVIGGFVGKQIAEEPPKPPARDPIQRRINATNEARKLLGFNYLSESPVPGSQLAVKDGSDWYVMDENERPIVRKEISKMDSAIARAAALDEFNKTGLVPREILLVEDSEDSVVTWQEEREEAILPPDSAFGLPQ